MFANEYREIRLKQKVVGGMGRHRKRRTSQGCFVGRIRNHRQLGTYWRSQNRRSPILYDVCAFVRRCRIPSAQTLGLRRIPIYPVRTLGNPVYAVVPIAPNHQLG